MNVVWVLREVLPKNPEGEDAITLHLKQSVPNTQDPEPGFLPPSSPLPWVASPGTLAHISGACGLGIAISQRQQGWEHFLKWELDPPCE